MIDKSEAELKKIMDFEGLGFINSISSPEIHDFKFGNKISSLIKILFLGSALYSLISLSINSANMI